MKHVLFICVAGLVLAALTVFAQSKPGAAKRVDAAEFDRLRQATNTVVLDVRTPGEFRGGHLAGAVNLDVTGDDFSAQIARLDKTKTYLVHCQSGGRSKTACAKLAGTGVTNLYELASGMSGWKSAGKPVQK